MKKLLLLAIVVLGISAVSFGQGASSATISDASATAKIIEPIQLSKSGVLAFGTIVPSTTAGTVVLTPSNTRTATGNVKLGASASSSVITFTVTGVANSVYAITLPANDAVELTSSATGAVGMKVTGFNTSLGATTPTIGAGGTQDFQVGATLKVGASQVVGDYSTEFAVTVAYN